MRYRGVLKQDLISALNPGTLACHIVDVHGLNDGRMHWQTCHDASGQLNEVPWQRSNAVVRIYPQKRLEPEK